MVVNVEQGAANPSVGTLLRLSDALGIGLPALVEPAAARNGEGRPHGEGAALWTGSAGGRGRPGGRHGAAGRVELWDWTLGAGRRHVSEAHTAGTKELLQVLEDRAVGVGDQS